MDSSKQFVGLPTNGGGLSKQFGVYTFEDKSPLIEKKARLIERLLVKKDPEDDAQRQMKVRSIPGGAGHQIVFSSKTERESALYQQRVEPPPMPQKAITDS